MLGGAWTQVHSDRRQGVAENHLCLDVCCLPFHGIGTRSKSDQHPLVGFLSRRTANCHESIGLLGAKKRELLRLDREGVATIRVEMDESNSPQ